MIKLVYEYTSQTSKQDSTLTTNDKKSWVDMSELKNELDPAQYASNEWNRTKLNGTFPDFPDTPPTGLGYESESLSDINGEFETPLTITRTFTQSHSAPGILFIFDRNDDGCYCNLLNVKWYRDATLLFDNNYTPNAVEYYCQQNVTAFNKIEITFYSTSKPFRYLRVFDITDGIRKTFKSDEIVGMKIIEEISESGEALSINTMTVNLNVKSDIEFMFQKTQPMKLVDDSTLIGKFLLNTSDRAGLSTYKLNASDYIAMLEAENFIAGLYTNKDVGELLDEILGDIPYTYEGSDTISGYIPICNKRTALQLIAFATGLVIDCSRSESIEIKTLSDTVTDIPANRVVRSPKETTSPIVTALELKEYKYTANTIDDAIELINEAVTGTHTYTFSEPHHTYTISNGTLVASGVNYATVTGTGATLILTAKGYDVSEKIVRVDNPLTVASDIPNVVIKSECRLITSSNSATIAARLADIYFRQKSLTGVIKLDGEKVGDMVTIPTEFGIRQGRITSISYDPTINYAQFKISEVTANE